MATLANTADLASIFPEESQIPAEFKVERVHQKEYLINGEIRTWEGPFQEVKSPVWYRTADGKLEQATLGDYPLLTSKEAEEALKAAVAAYGNGHGVWPSLSLAERIGHMQKFVMFMKTKREEVVKLLMWEIGKNLSDSRKEFDRTVDYIQDTIDALKDLDRGSSRFTITQGVIAQVRRAPLGVTLCMGPYNYPLNETFTTMIPAILMGNTVIFKPPRYGVLLHRPLMQGFRDCFPPGVVNTLYGRGRAITPTLMASGEISVLAFIGTSSSADDLKKQHPKPHRMRGVLGLEAKNAAIVLRDCDIEQAVKECVLGSLSYNGQRCTALKIIYVHKEIADKFIPAYVKAVGDLKIGMPWENAQITPLPNVETSGRMSGYVEDALAHGAVLLNKEQGGARVAGSFFHPAVLGNITSEMKVVKEEQFGPVVPITTFFDISEPLKFIEDSPYGQQVAIFGKNASQISMLVDRLVNQVCRVNINSQCQRGPDNLPFTGRKDSAESTLSVTDALRAFSIRTLVAAKSSEANNELLTDIVQNRKSNFLSTDFIF